MKHDNILGTVGNTPVVRINKLAPAGINLYVKIEAFNPLGSVKDRLALGVIEDAERTGALKPGQTVVVEGLQKIREGATVTPTNFVMDAAAPKAGAPETR